MPTTSIDSRLMNFGEVFAGSYYTVPSFQRDYSWTEDEVDQLWSDITDTLDEGRNEYFMGAIVVNNSKKPELVLIDGQQRVTTISILMCVLRDIAKEKGDNQLAQQISQSYLGSLDLRTRKTEPKLVLNDRNNHFYQENIVETKNEEELKGLSKKRNIDKSNKLILDAYLSLRQRVQERISKTEEFIEALIQIEECIKYKLISIVILVPDEANSYLIFETLNDRGLELSVADLLKNYLFSRASNRLPEFQRKWVEINQEVDRFELTKFIRYYWLSSRGVVREKELYRTIARELQKQSDVFNFLNGLREAAEVYGAFEKPDSSVWDLFGQDLKNDIARLSLFKVSQCYSVLLAAKESLPDDLFPKVLRMIVVISFRYNIICGFSPQKLESTYSDAAKYIRSQKPKSIKAIFDQLSKVYPSDTDFVRYFEVKSVSGGNAAKLARYILSEINSYYMGSKELVANPNGIQLNLEHILPQTPSDAWLVEFPKKDKTQYVYRLGNMTLLDSSVNRKVGNNSFQEKCSTAFSHSKLEITKEILNNSVWGPKQIEERQRKMAKAACQIWQLNY
jgi:uncharacterized protein with ParB-like and HNH nuclease domain